MLLEVESLSFSYDSSDFQFIDIPLLKDVAFTVNSGSILHVRGSNGSGKTTLLKIIAGILAPSIGDVKYDGCSIFPYAYDYKNAICYVGHKLGLNLQLTVLENCYYDLKNTKTKSEICNLLKIFSLDLLQDKIVGYLSAGQKKRLSLLRVLLTNTKLWILDEPFTALDKDFITTFVDCMHHHVMQQGMIIYTSHQGVQINDIPHTEYFL